MNGVARTLERLVEHLRAQGIQVLVLAPDGHRTVGLVSYPEIQVAYDPWRAIRRLVDFAPDAVHLATEGPIGFWARGWLGRRNLRFTSSFHTRYPEYMAARFGIPTGWGYQLERWFHAGADRTLVSTNSMLKELRTLRIGRQLVLWPRGVDAAVFHPQHRQDDLYEYKRPIWLFVGRIAVEKNLNEFLELRLPGTKVIVGDGPSRARFQQQYPDVVWRGYRGGQELSAHYASADYFVFPSRTETFGNVLLEALASGVPVASVPAPGPSDFIIEGVNGALDDDLRAACARVQLCERSQVRPSIVHHTIQHGNQVYAENLVPVHETVSKGGTASLWSGLGPRRQTPRATQRGLTL